MPAQRKYQYSHTQYLKSKTQGWFSIALFPRSSLSFPGKKNCCSSVFHLFSLVVIEIVYQNLQGLCLSMTTNYNFRETRTRYNNWVKILKKTCICWTWSRIFEENGRQLNPCSLVISVCSVTWSVRDTRTWRLKERNGACPWYVRCCVQYQKPG
jgi:hypothetical protein